MDIVKLKGYEEKFIACGSVIIAWYSSPRKTLSTSYAWFPGRNWKKSCTSFALEE
jgi:hypothetical protein